MAYDFKEVENKWIGKFDGFDGYKGKDFDGREKKYVLVEFPYPSGEGLHVGHAFSMTGADVYARFMRKQNKNVMFPMGFDAFGLPAENYAIKTGVQPQITTDRVTKLFKKQMDAMAFSFDWEREVNTTLPSYYKWTQWIFTKLFEKGLAFKKEMPINWCPSCKIGLANEEVIDGNCERCGTATFKRNISQWVVKITAYTDRLIEGLKDTNFIEKVKAAQVNWIGKKEGARIKFKLVERETPLEVFTTRPDTVFGSTFLVVAPEHPIVKGISDEKVVAYISEVKGKTEMDRSDMAREKTGVFSGLYAINPANDKKIPVWIADYVLMGFGTGAIMAVPAHDERDFDFAKKFGLDIVPVVLPQRVYVDENARSYYTKRHNENWKMLKQLSELAKQNKKTLMVGGGWGVAMNVGYEFRENEDIDMAILKSERDWWVKQFTDIGLNVEAQLGQEDEFDTWFLAVRNLPDGKDTHIDIDVLESIEGCREKVYQGCTFWVREPELIIKEKEEEMKSGKVGRWKEWSDFLMLQHKPYTESDGVLINSKDFNGLSVQEATSKVLDGGVGQKETSYHLRDWIFSRQHYWGEPIPMVDCSKCGWVTVPEEQLPVVLPEVEKYQPTDNGESPLANIFDWVKTTCPKCGGEAKRETDTMPNWAGSDWYFLRYCDNKNEKVLADMEKMKYWLPVDVYVGGDEHNTLHLLYSRFIYQFLYDLGAVPKEIPEPYKKRLSHGVILAPDGRRMSKSKGNVIAPEAMIEKYGTDVVRTYMMFMGPFDATMAWNERSLVGVKRFVERFFDFVTRNVGNNESDDNAKILVNKLVKVAGEDLGEFKFNTVVARLMETINNLTKEGVQISKEDLGKMVIVLSVFAPLVTEELWSLLGNTGSVHTALWPVVDEKYLVENEINLSVAINGKMRGVIKVAPDAEEGIVVELAKKEANVTKYLFEGELVKTIYVKGRTLNFVVK